MVGRLELISQLARQIARSSPEELDCDQVFELLDQYTEAVVRGEPAAELQPLVQQHIDLCPDCREEFDVLLRVLGKSVNGEVINQSHANPTQPR